MNTIKLLAVASVFVMTSSLLALPVADAVIVSSAANCEAANLVQATKGIGWSQAGIKNNATIPLFVVCPLSFDTAVTVTGAVVIATFPGSTGTVACTARAQAILGGAYTSASFTINSSGGSVGVNRGMANVVLGSVTAANRTVVCALDPGEGIESSWVL